MQQTTPAANYIFQVMKPPRLPRTAITGPALAGVSKMVMASHFVLKSGRRELVQQNRALAGELLLIIQMAAEKVGWRDEQLNLLPPPAPQLVQ